MDNDWMLKLDSWWSIQRFKRNVSQLDGAVVGKATRCGNREEIAHGIRRNERALNTR